MFPEMLYSNVGSGSGIVTVNTLIGLASADVQVVPISNSGASYEAALTSLLHKVSINSSIYNFLTTSMQT